LVVAALVGFGTVLVGVMGVLGWAVPWFWVGKWCGDLCVKGGSKVGGLLH